MLGLGPRGGGGIGDRERAGEKRKGVRAEIVSSSPPQWGGELGSSQRIGSGVLVKLRTDLRSRVSGVGERGL